MKLLIIALLAWIAYKDIQTRQIQHFSLSLLTVFSILSLLLERKPIGKHLLSAAAIFLFLLVFSALTNCFGGGDVKLCGICCLNFTFMQGLYFICLAIIFLYIYYYVSLRRQKQLPFAPFVLGAYLFTNQSFYL